jgi:hypothetical protein
VFSSFHLTLATLFAAATASAQTTHVASSQPAAGHAQFIPFSQALPILQTFSADLPEELVHTVAARDAAEWDRYVHVKDAETRRRLHAGDLDTLANLLLFGTSFTSAPKMTPEMLKNIRATPQTSTPSDPGSRALLQRLEDLTSGLAHPAGNERLAYFHQLLDAEQYRFGTPQELLRVKQFLAANLLRMLREDASYAAALDEAQRLQEAGLAKRSQVFAQRGISLDTSLFPNYAIEQALLDAKKQGLLPAPVTRVGVIGPGLDVVNKDEGLDYYPEQTIQPFLLADSLVRLKLADAQKLQITTFDVSDLVNRHLQTARSRAQAGHDYVMQLPIRSDIPWTQAALAYWKTAGNSIGGPATPLKSRSELPLSYKAIRIAPAEVLEIHPVDLDIIYQRQPIADADRLDLIIATNMFVYYGSVEQALAMDNVASMLRNNGLLFTNDALPEAASIPLRAAGRTDVPYSSRPHDGDTVVWYRNH